MNYKFILYFIFQYPELNHKILNGVLSKKAVKQVALVSTKDQKNKYFENLCFTETKSKVKKEVATKTAKKATKSKKSKA